MRALQPITEDFLYWDPDEICAYPQEEGPEDEWFIKQPHLCVVVEIEEGEAANDH